MASEDESNLSAAQMAECSALADGSLDPSRRAGVEARIMASPELRDRFERERRVVEVLRAARADERAPLALRERIEAARPGRAARTRRRGAYTLVSGAALAAVIVALGLALPSGTPGSPTVSQAAALAVRGPSPARGVPLPEPGNPRQLDQQVGNLYFPNYAARVGYRPVGQRIDRVGGRTVVTVYYDGSRGQVAYSIVGAPPLRQPGGEGRHVGGFFLRAARMHGRTLVTWVEDGHTCILSGAGVSTQQLSALASSTWPGTGS